VSTAIDGVVASGWCGVDPHGAFELGPVRVEFEDGAISALDPAGRSAVDGEFRDAVLVPGFVDLQVNGMGRVDFANADAAAWEHALDAMAAAGTTTAFPTFVTAPLDQYAPWLARLRDAQTNAEEAGDRPTIHGAHLEGPFLGGAPGAHAKELIRPVDAAWLRELLEARPHLVSIVTLAPEADPDGEAIRLLRLHGVTVALGHTTATYEACRAAADAGARLVTHLFNGMNALGHRAPGVPGAALDDDRLTPSLIADLVHVHPAALRLAIASKRNVALVTDAVGVGSGHVGVVEILERDGAAYLGDGTLAGSTLTMDRAVRNVVGLGVPLARAVEMAATVPCDVVGLTDRGRLAVGARADVVALDRASLAVEAVWIAGRRVH
jgi:N-acetylglucosamine-6-phosphate deacetylase